MGIHTRLIKIGNSHGIRIPKTLLKQLDLSGEVELLVEEGRLIIQAARRPRRDWEASFESAPHARDELTNDFTSNRFDDEEWTW